MTMKEGKKWFVIDFYDFVYSIFLLLIVFLSVLVGSLDFSTGWLVWNVLVGDDMIECEEVEVVDGAELVLR